jgi:hypothetical protein
VVINFTPENSTGVGEREEIYSLSSVLNCPDKPEKITVTAA